MRTAARLRTDDIRGDFAEAVLAGLGAKPKSIPSRFFYDTRGSELFEQITELEEYYPTRAEIALLESHAEEIAALVGPSVCLIEFGSGSSRKTDRLIEALPALGRLRTDRHIGQRSCRRLRAVADAISAPAGDARAWRL